MTNWRTFFNKKIMTRGQDCFNRGLVDDLEYDDTHISAVVCGSEDYDVSIRLDDGEVTDMDCTCPYAEDGNDCKHMAAVLLAYESETKTAAIHKAYKLTSAELVQAADEDTLREFVLGIIKNDRHLRARLELAVNKSSGSADISVFKKNIERMIRSFGGRYGYIEYRDADRFVRQMLSVIDTDISGLVSQGNIAEAFELSIFFLNEISDVDIDDSDGGLSELMSAVWVCWEDMLSLADDMQKNKMFVWFYEKARSRSKDFFDECSEDFFFKHFDDDEFLNKKLEMIDDELKSSPDSDDHFESYAERSLVMRRIYLMEELHMKGSEIMTFCKIHENIPHVRKYMTDYYISHNMEDEAITLLTRSIELDSKYIGLVNEYRNKLKDIYKRRGDTEAYKLQLTELVQSRCDIDDYRELKAQYSEEEWHSVREMIISEVNYYKRAEIYAEEGLYDRLMDYAEKSFDLSPLRQYEKLLVKFSPERVLKVYEAHLRKAACHASGRSYYADWANTIKHMQSIKGGKAIAEKIAADWREQYKNRPAMMQEMDRAGV